ncbi:response regulator transcription factor [Roseivirga sp.]|uniref:response regulator transcription factor n=1 Tax=Roseivirga sp. TaxID=1964215 RepID=UPI003B8B07C7
MSDINSFFSSNNTVWNITETDAKQINNYLAVVDAFSRATNKSIYIIDYEKKGFEYVSSNPLFLNGHSREEVLEMGYEFYFKYVPKEDLELLLKINAVGFEFYETIELEQRKDGSISYDFHIKTADGNLVLINQQLTPLFLTERGKIWKAICIVSLSENKKSGNIIIHRNSLNESFEYDLQDETWRRLEQIVLTDREKEIMQYSIRGHSINEIADRIFVSPDTVKFHRKKIFEKLNVANISEAVSYATRNNLL